MHFGAKNIESSFYTYLVFNFLFGPWMQKLFLYLSLLALVVVEWFSLGGFNYAFFQSSILTSDRQIASLFPLLDSPDLVCPYDLQSETSFQKYLSDNTPFTKRSYVPDDLVPINSHFTANNSTKFQLREEAGILFADMARQFWHDFDGDRLVITSAYRSPAFQNYLLRGFCKKDQCAIPGTSEHQAWLAIDLAVKTKKGTSKKIEQGTIYYNWFLDNAHLYGFHNTYQKWVDIDGKMVEWRHRRYMWVPLATLLRDSQQTFAEWMTTGSNLIWCPSLQDILTTN